MPKHTHKPVRQQKHKKVNARKREPAKERNMRLHQHARVTGKRGG